MKLLILCAAMSLAATSAYAADTIVEEEVAAITPNTFSWTGGYIGINAGYAGGKFKNDISGYLEPIPEGARLTRPTGLAGLWDLTASGFVGGVQAGYNWQLRNGLVLGAEADFQGATLKSKDTGSDRNSSFFENSELTTKVQWWGTVRARLGYTPVERLLVYGTGGLAYGKVKTSYNYNHEYIDFDISSHPSFSTSKTKAGWTVGAGAEYAITGNWTLKSEYLYTDLGTAKMSALMRPFGEGDINSKVKFHTVRVGLNYKF